MSKKEFPNIPGYRIEKVLGEGGMGIVYLAIQIALDRKVALKVTLPALAEMDSSFTKRFVREAVATAALTHQNIITVYDAGVFEKSSYMAMEYIPSGTLANLDKSKLSNKKICQLFIGICQGLAAAHRAGFVHRDIKPDNILIDSAGLPVVTDFGIVKSLGNQNTAITIAGGTIGTPKYMSPEQIKAEDLDGRSDLYSTGVMLYNLLEGHAPFVDATPSAVYIMHVTTEPPPLSDKNHEFQKIISCLLQKNPNDRYKDAEALISALEYLKTKAINGAEQIVKAPKSIKQNKVRASPAKKKSKLPVSKPKNQNAQKTKITNQDTVLNFSKTPPVTRKYVSPKGSAPSSSQNNNKFLAVGGAILLFVVGYFVYYQYGKNQSTTDLQIVEETRENSLDKDDWLKAKNNNTQESYVKYLSSYPKGVFSIEAKNNLKIIREKIKQDILDKERQLAVLIKKQLAQDKALQKKQAIELDTNKTKQLPELLIADSQPSIDVLNEIQTEPVAEESISITNIKPVEIVNNRKEITELLTLAKSDLDKWKLMSPKNANAYDRYNQVLTLDSENQEARKGLLQVIYKYTVMANKKVRENNYSAAKLYINNAISIRNEYLSKAFSENEFYGVSQVIALNELISAKDSINNQSIIYNKKQVQLTAARAANNKDTFYDKGQLAYKAKGYTRALELIEKAAKLNHIDAQLLLGDMYHAGQGVVQNSNKAVEWFKRAASQDSAKGQYLLGLSYLRGAGVAQSDSDAIMWFSKAANQNYAQAQNSLGQMYYKGKGVEKNEKKAFGWFQKSGNQGLADGQDNLGLMYLKGIGVKRSYEESFKWYKRAALQDHINAQALLGTMHEFGRGVKRSEGKAIFWYKKAAKQGNKLARKKLKQRKISKSEYN